MICAFSARTIFSNNSTFFIYLFFMPVVGRAETELPAEWPMLRRLPEGTAFIDLKVKAPASFQSWRFRASSHVSGYQPGMSVWSSAALGLVKDRPLVFMGSYDNNLYCLDALSGEKLWRFTTGDGIYSAPALYVEQSPPLVFVASSDRTVYALDADLGKRVWTYAVQSWRPTIGGARLAAPCVGVLAHQAAVFVAHWVWDKSLSGYMQKSGVTALDAVTGTVIWTRLLGDSPLSSPIFKMIEKRPHLFIASENGNLYALNAANGEMLWKHTERNAIKASPAFFDSAAGPRVVIGSKHGIVRSLDAKNGKLIWSFKTGHWVDGSCAVAKIGKRSLVFVGSYDNHLYALDGETGEKIWSYATAGGIYSSPAVIPDKVGSKVLVAAWDHHLHCVNAEDGSLVWRVYIGRPIWDSLSLGDSIWSSPVTAKINGRAVVIQGSYSGEVYAIAIDEAEKIALARHGSNLNFWVSMPVVMFLLTGVLLLLTRRYRRKNEM